MSKSTETNKETVFINNAEYDYDDLSEKAKVSYQHLISLRTQLAEVGMKRDQLLAAQSVFESVLTEEITASPEDETANTNSG